MSLQGRLLPLTSLQGRLLPLTFLQGQLLPRRLYSTNNGPTTALSLLTVVE